MPPVLAPTKKRLVTVPEMVIWRSASERVVGKIEAIDRPAPAAPSQVNVLE